MPRPWGKIEVTCPQTSRADTTIKKMGKTLLRKVRIMQAIKGISDSDVFTSGKWTQEICNRKI